MKRLGFLVIINLALISCASESYSSSPLSNAFTSQSSSTINTEVAFSNFIVENVNASELNALISSFPTYNNEKLDKEITYMKINLQTYLYAIEAGNREAKTKSYNNFEKRYVKIQNLRKSLNADQEEVLNRYLVRIKTNISEIEAVVNQ